MASPVSYQRILIVNIFGIGDVLFATPLARNIKLALPQARIDFVCNKRAEAVVKTNKDIQNVYVYERDDLVGMWKADKKQCVCSVWDLFRTVKNTRYDAMIDLSLSPQAGFFALMAGIRERIGFDYRGRGFWLTQKIKLAGYEGKPVADFYLDLLEKMGIRVQERKLLLDVQAEDHAWAENFLRAQGVNSRDTLVACIPGGGASWGKAAGYKRWPAQRYAKLADKIIEKSHAKIILIGDALEEILCEEVMQQMVSPCIKVLGKTSLGQFAALLSRCRLAIVNDGGPLHVAVAVGVPTVSIFGPVDEKVYGPYPSQGHHTVTASVLCRPCYRRFRVAECSHRQCIKRISVDDVLSRIGEII
ncbi:MAG TPA: glycosyltransferase family 9 protein [Candidatus Omnitrophota bacterium]|nr:glycosyltransferase family 9 protein [Candidatus Omnitrophota bacterium]HQL41585.1 glycosyltransferase family 9 protein [Candidatus Omnitrophota bacterium]